eukprot:scaffold71782_cov54-Phaeocystis_antarctica.AAC.2
MPRAAHLGRRSWLAATDRPRASATSCAAENCIATERRCVVNAMYVEHVSDAVSLLERHSAPLVLVACAQRSPQPQPDLRPSPPVTLR